jgi:hypothetical protein
MHRSKNITNSLALKSSIIDLVKSYSKIGIRLSEDEIYELCNVYASRKEIKNILVNLLDERLLRYIDFGYVSEPQRYFFDEEKQMPSQVKINMLKGPLDAIFSIPFVVFIGISGSCTYFKSMKKSDVDIFVVTKANTLFITRLLVYFIGTISRTIRTRNSVKVSNKICPNVFIEESQIDLPYPKQNIFVARELSRLKTYRSKKNYFLDFYLLHNSDMMHRYLPNYGFQKKVSLSSQKKEEIGTNYFLSLLNKILGFAQLWQMRKSITNEIVGWKGLWLHPDTRLNKK